MSTNRVTPPPKGNVRATIDMQGEVRFWTPQSASAGTQEACTSG